MMKTTTRSRRTKHALFTAALAMALTTTVNAAPPLDDSQIFGIYLQVNSFDIEAALLGRAQGGTDAVRKLAEHVASDHLGVRQTAQTLAGQCKVSPLLPEARRTVAIEHDKVMAALLPLKDAAFDKAYLQHEVAFHRAAIDAINAVLLPSARCAQLQAHLKAILPAFQQHLAHTEMLARAFDAKE
jgi:putative membrane protein